MSLICLRQQQHMGHKVLVNRQALAHFPLLPRAQLGRCALAGTPVHCCVVNSVRYVVATAGGPEVAKQHGIHHKALAQARLLSLSRQGPETRAPLQGPTRWASGASYVRKSGPNGKELLPADAHFGDTGTACAHLRQDAVMAVKRKAAHVYAVAVVRFCCG